MNFLKKLGAKVDKAFENKEVALLQRNDLNEIKAYLNNEVLFKLYIHMDKIIKADKWSGQIKVELDEKNVSRIELVTDENVIYIFYLNFAHGKTVKNLQTKYEINLRDSSKFFKEYGLLLYKEIEKKELARFV